MNIFSPWSALRGTLTEIPKQHSPWSNLKGEDSNGNLSHKQWQEAWDRGYFADIVTSMRQSSFYAYFGSSLFSRTLLTTAILSAALGRLIYADMQLYGTITRAKGDIKERWRYIQYCRFVCFQFRQFFSALTQLLKIQKEFHLYNAELEQAKETLQKPEIQEIITLLYTDTFKEQEGGWFFNYGRVLLTHKKIKEHIETCIPLLRFVAEFDAYLAVATMFCEQQKPDRKFCFVEFLSGQTGAVLHAKNAWLPLIPEESVIQDIRLGHAQDMAQHMIITGPNWSGKSMYLKMTGLVAFLAQAFGIAPAESCSITPFDFIETCLDPQGNVKEGLSKFAKQKDCVAEIEEHIFACTEEKKGLFLIDEIFNGTVDDIITLKTIEFAEKVANNRNSIVIFTTHLEDPTILEVSTNGLFKNFHVDIIPQPDGSFVRTFKVMPGIPVWWFDKNQRQLRVQFTDWIDDQLAKKRIAKKSPLTQ